MSCFSCDGILSLGCIRIDLRMWAPLKMTYSLVYEKILLNSSVRPGTYGTEMKTFLLTSKPISGFTIGVVSFFYNSLIIQSG